jgi:hypothetical protein
MARNARPTTDRILMDEYARRKRDVLGAEERYLSVLAAWEERQANTVLAVDSARDGQGKPLFSNEKTRAAEVLARMGMEQITDDYNNARRAFKHAEVEAKIAGMACRMWMASVYRVEEDDSDLHEAD